MKVRSTFGTPVEREIVWKDDEIHPYTDLDGWRIRDTPHGAFFAPINKQGEQTGDVKVERTLAAALAGLGWVAV